MISDVLHDARAAIEDHLNGRYAYMYQEYSAEITGLLDSMRRLQDKLDERPGTASKGAVERRMAAMEEEMRKAGWR